MDYSVSLIVNTDDPSKVSKATEVLARTMTGLMFEGFLVSMIVSPEEDDDDDV